MDTAKILPVNLTDKRAKILELILDFQEVNGYPPSLRELQAELGLASVSTIAHYLEYLRHVGFVTWREGLPRTLRVTPEGETALSRRVL